MKLDLSEIARTPGMRFHYDIDEPCAEDDGMACVEPVRGAIDFTNTGRTIMAKGSFQTTVELECSRCLTKFAVPVSSEIEEHFIIPPQMEDAEAEEEDEDLEELEDEQAPLFVDGVLDLTELLRQDLIVAVPIRPLCEEACKGLCATCGQNLNQTQCECEQPAVNEAFANLAEMWQQKHTDGDAKAN